MNDDLKRARALAVTLLNGEPEHTTEAIRRCVESASLAIKAQTGSDFDKELLVAQLMHESNVYVPNSTLMEDATDHIEWLPARRGSIEWNFWQRYESLLETEKGFPPNVVRALDTLTDDILSRLENPERQAPWDCRGMVVGSVQSGKTANYCGLICKAIDAGYKLIVILAGMHNNLRSQTQYRIDEGVLGRDSQKERSLDQSTSLIGVGKLFGQVLPVHTLTNSLEDGDFKAPKAEMGVTIGGDPVVLVIKKNGSVLKNLQKWVLHARGEEDHERNRRVVRNVPLLVIDDEADNASINTKDKKGKTSIDNDVTAINGRIRELLDSFDKSAYIGYTATPFANIFINPDAETPKHGEDLFPRSFILNVSPPSTYVSPARVFGVDGDPDAGIEPHAPLPLLRTVQDHAEIFPHKHKKELTVSELPPSLKKAILAFLLTCAARRARGQVNVHNSMLIHVTRYIDVQHLVTEIIQQHVQFLRRRLDIGEGARKDKLTEELKQLWLKDFEPTTEKCRSMINSEPLPRLTWEQVLIELPEAAARIEVREINGHAKEALDYVNHRDGFSVISVGGDKLSRGLTLEGLTVSYFLRASRMYDTLMQMGRWFGYRPAYVDLCRLYTTEDLAKWYRHIAQAEIELRREFDKMKYAGLTPKKYGLRVRQSPNGLLITAMNKMSHARTQQLSYAGQLVQTAHFDLDEPIMARNLQTTGSFLNKLGIESLKKHERASVWTNVGAERVLLDLLTDFQVSNESWRFQKPELIEFIRKQNEIGELTHWTVALVDSAGTGEPVTIGPITVKSVQRKLTRSANATSSSAGVLAASNSNIQSPNHQAIDLYYLKPNVTELDALLAKRYSESAARTFSDVERELIRECVAAGKSLGDAAELVTHHRRANKATLDASVRVTGDVARQLRPKTHGFLIIYTVTAKQDEGATDKSGPFVGLVISFPSSDTARSVNYKVNKIWQNTFEDDDFTDED